MSKSPASHLHPFNASPSLLVSLVAAPWLITITTVKAASEILERVGLVSEEIFRGDRLPVLHLPVSETAPPTDRPD
jgi:hypothetical protein